jgi:hypothetical protein
VAAGVVFNKEVERIVDGIVELSDDALAKLRVARPLTEAAAPEGALKLTRVWRSVDQLMGPGHAVLETLLARYARLQDAMDGMSSLLRRGLRARTEATRRVILSEMDRRLKDFSRLKGEIAKAAGDNADAITRKLKAEMAGTKDKKLLSGGQIKREAQSALDEAEKALENQRKAVAKKVDSSPGAEALKKKAESYVAKAKAAPDVGPRAFISSRIKRVLELKNGQKLAADFAAKVKRKVRRFLPLIDEVEDAAPFFMDALGVAASAKPDGAKLLRRWAEGGKLSAKETERISGYLGQIRGLLPEEAAVRMKFLESVFHRSAFEFLTDFPPKLRGRMGVEMVEGPLWVMGSGAPRQFGDGCLLLTGPNGQSAIVGLGEFKAGFDEDLFTQLFARSDGRAVDATVTFLDKEGKSQMRTLTREFSFEGGEKAAVTRPPSYVYGRSAGETRETAEAFKKMVEEQMRSGREVWKVPLPFSAKQNDKFTDEALKEAVRTMIQAEKKWGL